MRARDAGLSCGSLPLGERNSIADVPGVAVGHATLAEGDIRAGVTAVLPHDGDLFHDKVVASAYVLNGFGKSTGLMQLNELDTAETPILLTNTFAVGICSKCVDPPDRTAVSLCVIPASSRPSPPNYLTLKRQNPLARLLVKSCSKKLPHCVELFRARRVPRCGGLAILARAGSM